MGFVEVVIVVLASVGGEQVRDAVVEQMEEFLPKGGSISRLSAVIDTHGEATVPILVEYSKDRRWDARATAVGYLPRFPGSALAVDACIDAIADSHSSVRETAVRCVLHADSALVAERRDEVVRLAEEAALGRGRDLCDAVKLILQAGTAATAIPALNRIWEKGQLLMSRGKPPELLLCSESALSRLGDDAAYSRLVNRLSTDDLMVEYRVLSALAEARRVDSAEIFLGYLDDMRRPRPAPDVVYSPMAQIGAHGLALLLDGQVGWYPHSIEEIAEVERRWRERASRRNSASGVGVEQSAQTPP